MEEGVTNEAASLAGHQELGNLIAIYDSNQISIEDDTNIAFTEDVHARFLALGWDVHVVDWKKTGEYIEDVQELNDAIEAAKGVTDKPSLIILKTIIGWPAPHKQNSGKAHGSALGAEEVAALKRVVGFDPDKNFDVDPEVLAHTREAVDRGKAQHAEWNKTFDAWAAANPERKKLLDRVLVRQGSRRHRGGAARLPGGQGCLDPRRVRQGRSTRSRRSCPSCGAAPPTSPSRTSPPSRAADRSFPRSGRRTSGRATRTVACCTSASASTRWATS